MMKQLILFITLCASAVLAACNNGGPSAGQTAPQRLLGAIPSSVTVTLPLGAVFNYGVQDYNSEVQDNVRAVWGANYAVPQGIINLAYTSQNVAYTVIGGVLLPQSLAWFQATHPDWIEYQCDEKTPAWEFGAQNVPIDFANPAVQHWMMAYWVIPALAQGYNGVAFDNVGLVNAWGRCGHFNLSGQWVQQYSGAYLDSAYAEDTIAWAQVLRTLMHTYAAAAVFAVNYSWNDSVPAVEQTALLSYPDAVMDEGGQTQGGFPMPESPQHWLAVFQADTALQQRGGCVFFNEELSNPQNAAARLWAIANFLMIENGCAWLSIEGQQQYGSIILWPEYYLNYGRPLDAPTELSDGTWVRHFTHATVTINPNDGGVTLIN